jgi:hypothetical protein
MQSAQKVFSQYDTKLGKIIFQIISGLVRDSMMLYSIFLRYFFNISSGILRELQGNSGRFPERFPKNLRTNSE